MPPMYYQDLSVRCEGTFVLRYRAGTVYSQGGTPLQSPILAECFGGPFKIYATKEFPGLSPSTELTKARCLPTCARAELTYLGFQHLWRQNIRVIIRQAAGRYSRKPVQGSDTPDNSGASGAGGGDASEPILPNTTHRTGKQVGKSTSTRSGTRKWASDRTRLADAGGSSS